MSPEPVVSLEPVYMTVKQVADLMQVESIKTVYGWVKADPTMPVIKIGGTVRFPRERLLKWLEQREQGRARPRRVRTAAPAREAGT